MPLRTVKLLSAALLAAALLAGCYANPAPPGLTPIPTLAAAPTLQVVAAVAAPPTSAPRPTGPVQGNAQDGQAVYTQYCAACHGADAGGGVGPALKNSKYIQTAGDDKVFETIANGRPGTAMPAWSQAKGGKLTDAQINDTIAYLHTLQP